MSGEHFSDQLQQAIESAERWAISDPDPVTRGQIDEMVDDRDARLIELFDGRLAFGTAGLRAEVGPGPNRMNALIVRQTTYAVVHWLIDERGVGAPSVVIGFDARHDSADFARHAAAAVRAAGGTPLLADGPAATPVFAHALLAEQADAAIVVTASHNPPADNGYKLYLGDGLQLVSPFDVELAQRIDAIAASWHAYGIKVDDRYAAEADAGAEARPVGQWRSAHNGDAVAALFTTERDVRVVYTPMHGVGGSSILDAFQRAGFPAPIIVKEQFEPDPNFPTVQFPNPEEPGAFDLALALAANEDADVAFANDPDADRLAIAVPSRSGEGFTPLSGNQLGALLANHVLRHTSGPDRLVTRSVVSSRQLDAIAQAAGVHCEVTLTGFKWVARPIVSQPDKRFVFGFEEAIGYCVGDRVRDKDGVTAALVTAEIFAELRTVGSTVWERLDGLAAEHGVYANHPISVRFDEDPSRVGQLMKLIMAGPPEHLGGSPIEASGAIGLGALPPTPGLQLLTADNTQVIVRPSGTEPKLKAYIEVIEPVDVETGVAAARERAADRLEAVVADVRALLGN